MNFGKLLGLGKSFFGSDPSVGYRLNKRGCIPKFNEGKNPFVPKTAEMPAETLAALAPKSHGVAAKMSGLTIAQAVEMARQNGTLPYAFKPAAAVQVPKAAPKPANQPAPAPVSAKPAKSAWTTRLNPFRASEPVQAPAVVQAELSLDAVKVVHNDLADADVEVVPVKSHTAPEAAVLPPARRAWEYMGENLLKSS